MAAVLDQNGNVIADDGAGDSVNLSPDVGLIGRQIAAFQDNVNALDNAAQTLLAYRAVSDLPDTDPLMESINAQLADYDDKKTAIKFTADAFNTVSGIANTFGASLATVALPAGLGVAPLVVAGGVAAAIGGAYLLNNWITAWIAAAYDNGKSLVMAMAPGPEREAALERLAGESAANGADGFSNTLKWLAIAAAAYFAYRAYQGVRGKQA